MMWFICSDESFIQNRSFIASSDMSHDHSSSSFFPPSCCSDEAVIGQYNLNATFLRLNATSHRRHFTVIVSLTILCLSMHCHSIAKPLQRYRNLTVQLSAHFTWWFDYERSAVMLPTLWQDYKRAAMNKTAVWLRGFSNFENSHNAWRQDSNMAMKVRMMAAVLPQLAN